MFEEIEIEQALSVAKKQNVKTAYLYNCNGDRPGFAESATEAMAGNRTCLGRFNADEFDDKELISEAALRLVETRVDFGKLSELRFAELQSSDK